MNRLRFVLPALAVATFIIIGCGGSFIGGSTSTALDGTWTLDSMTVNGVSQTCPATAVISAKASVTCSRFSDTYNDDGSMSRTTADGLTTVAGSYSYNGTVLTIAFSNIDTQVPITLNTGAASFTTIQNVFGYNVSYSYIKQ